MTREEAIKRLREYAQYSYGIWHNDEEDTKAFELAIEALSADLVRCKDCLLAQDDTTHLYCSYFGHKVYEDDFFCAYGERREP